jgi:hypothetical protein
MSKVVPIVVLAVWGLILVNVLNHVKGTQALSQGVSGVLTPAEQAITGYGTSN